jgi:N-acetylglucosamine-6-phosphate deacetylase
LLPTLITDAPEKLQQLARIAPEALAIAGVLGFHLEGPALNPARKGIHPPRYIRALTAADKEALLSFAAVGRSVVTLAPEQADAGLVRSLAAAGLRIAAGHSEATAAQMRAAVAAGTTGVTHLFNAMSQITAREPGVVGAALADDRLYAGIICDGLHVDPLNLKIAFRAKGRERLMLVTDAMATAGSAVTRFTLTGRDIALRDGRLTGPDGTLAGAHLTMIEAVRNAVDLMEIRLEDALVMASRTPAAFLGLGDRRGRITPGSFADLVAFTPDWRIAGTWIGGAYATA